MVPLRLPSTTGARLLSTLQWTVDVLYLGGLMLLLLPPPPPLLLLIPMLLLLLLLLLCRHLLVVTRMQEIGMPRAASAGRHAAAANYCPRMRLCRFGSRVWGNVSGADHVVGGAQARRRYDGRRLCVARECCTAGRGWGERRSQAGAEPAPAVARLTDLHPLEKMNAQARPHAACALHAEVALAAHAHALPTVANHHAAPSSVPPD